MFSSFPREPSVAGSKNDFVFFFSGTLETNQGQLIPAHRKGQAVDIDVLEVILQQAPTGQAAVFGFFKNGGSIGTVTVSAGATTGSTTLNPAVRFESGDVATATITQVGKGVYGKTATMYMRVA